MLVDSRAPLRIFLLTINRISTSAPSTCSASLPLSDLQSKHLHSAPDAWLEGTLGAHSSAEWTGGTNMRTRLRLGERPWLLWPWKSVRVYCGCPLTFSAANPCRSMFAPFPPPAFSRRLTVVMKSHTWAETQPIRRRFHSHTLYTPPWKQTPGKNTSVLWANCSSPSPICLLTVLHPQTATWNLSHIPSGRKNGYSTLCPNRQKTQSPLCTDEWTKQLDFFCTYHRFLF